jgi:hypothetical protein
MIRRLPVLIALVLFWLGQLSIEASPKRKIPCKTSNNEKSCYWTHGRLVAGNGTPSLRLWPIGTKHLLGIYSGPSVDRHSLDNENPELPANLMLKFKPFENRVYADFEVCPLETARPGSMQAACVETAKNIVVEEFER